MLGSESRWNYGSELPIPAVMNSTYDIIANNPLFNYPIKLNNELCWPSTLAYCINHKDDNSNCCTQFYDKNSRAYETITTINCYLIIFFISVPGLIFRIIIWKNIITNKIIKYINIKFYYKIFMDSFLGLTYSMLFTSIIANYIKYAVSAPRPIYYALELYSSIYENERERYHGKLIHTFTYY
jgi:hypothetical protein